MCVCEINRVGGEKRANGEEELDICHKIQYEPTRERAAEKKRGRPAADVHLFIYVMNTVEADIFYLLHIKL